METRDETDTHDREELEDRYVDEVTIPLTQEAKERTVSAVSE